jgi:hypothetical protein
VVYSASSEPKSVEVPAGTLTGLSVVLPTGSGAGTFSKTSPWN